MSSGLGHFLGESRLIFLKEIVQSGAALAAALKCLMVEKCPKCLTISLKHTFSLIMVRTVASYTSHKHLAGMVENVGKNDGG